MNRAAEKGLYQAHCDYILGYYETKAEATDVASAHAKAQAMQGWEAGSSWSVGLVIDTDRNTDLQYRQMSDGSGRQQAGYNTYDVVVTSTVAFGKASYTFSRQVVERVGNGQGKVR